ncbi:MAG TPA: putative toxin-antitoxin system toxin component, PIN family [Pyrinomonadaceae bacterium]|jgi:putative PIN family toxin of toxin-antitoxin system
MNEDDPRPRVVFDCMVYLQATVSESGPAATLLRLIDSDALALFVSNDTLEEVREVLSRPKIRKRNPEITDARVDALINRVLEKAIVVNDVRQHFIYSRDPKDEKYINLAVESEASYLVSRDKDLLDLMTGHTDECKDFRRRFRQLEIIGPVEFLKVLTPKEADKPAEES